MADDDNSIRSVLRLRPGIVNLAGYDTGATSGAPGKKAKTAKDTATSGPETADLQERLWAEGTRSILLVLQGIDTAGKGGVVEHVVGLLGPAGVRYTAFKAPTPEERAHHFLWRIRKRLPGPGIVGVFDRSHYEDVLVPRVHELIPEAEWRRRYDEINTFEADLMAGGTKVIKCFLHISYATQRQRLLARLDDPDKRWKFHESDITERAYWSDYQLAFSGMLQNCSTEDAPWHVIPSDNKWYRNWAIGQILLETLREMDPQYPEPDLDVPRLRSRLQPPY
ncbi:MAG: polyphosphate kinase 2 family protein [Actinobacteria bacterium]|nr:polyphosphate kinase 2 family protein [Actinomycetota bacterium]